MKKFFYIFSAAVLFCLTGCANKAGSYYDNAVAGSLNMHRIAGSDMHLHNNERNPAIFIHGLMGAVLKSEKSSGTADDVVWGRFIYRDMADRSLFWKIALPLVDNGNNAALVHGNILNASQIRVGGVSAEIGNYKYVIELLQSMGYVLEKTPAMDSREGANLFIFTYDWRQSIDENAVRLAAFIDECKSYLQMIRARDGKKSDNEIRFDLIGHSMGGLIARYYVMYGNTKMGGYRDPLPVMNWGGAKNVRKVIAIATPNNGYADAFMELVNGLKLADLAPVCPAGVLGTFYSCYQMMPDPDTDSVLWKRSGKKVDIFNIALWKKYRWGMLGENEDAVKLLNQAMPDADEQIRQNVALERVHESLKKALRFKRMMNKPMGLPPDPVRFYGFASAGLPTNTVLEVDEDTGAVSVLRQAPGDGKVCLNSALAELDTQLCPVCWHSTYVLDGAHMGIMRSELFIRNLTRVLVCE